MRPLENLCVGISCKVLFKRFEMFYVFEIFISIAHGRDGSIGPMDAMATEFQK